MLLFNDVVKTLVIKYGIYANIFAEKCEYLLHLQKLLKFFSKNICELDIVLTSTVNILTTKELVRLKMLWTTEPRSSMIKEREIPTWDAAVASSGFLSSRILKNLGNRKDIPFWGSTWKRCDFRIQNSKTFYKAQSDQILNPIDKKEKYNSKLETVLSYTMFALSSEIPKKTW